ncbi:hypothetical protein [Sphingobium sp. HWE2-09]|uniref:hypothetical protein n=1 Tax=Sphingobium sp. HWE2-09 TaxID=3108390 RepID=UPI002DC1D0E2|nr:hypothetical protein [Sphingobium sp. HWE2-09]
MFEILLPHTCECLSQWVVASKGSAAQMTGFVIDRAACATLLTAREITAIGAA